MQLQFISAIILIPLCFFSLADDWQTATSLRSLDSARESVVRSLEPSTSWERTTREKDLEHGAEKLSALSGRRNLLHPVHYEAGRAQLLLALRASDSKDSLEKFCSAREHFLKASRKNPMNPVYHISVADIESLSPLLSSTCDAEKKEGRTHTPDVAQRLALVAALAPVDLTSIYKSAIIYNQIGERERSLAAFRRYQELAPSTPWQIRNHLISIPRNESEVLKIIPRKYPDIIEWIRIFKDQRKEEYENHSGVFQEIITDIINRELDALHAGNINEAQFIQMLLTFSSHEITLRNQSLRSRIHTLLSEYYQTTDDSFAAELTSLYATSKRLPLAKSFEFSRKSPASGMLHTWHHDLSTVSVQLDLKAAHLGFFVAEPEAVSLITLTGSTGQIIPDSLSVKMWTSLDNRSFTSYRGALDIRHGEINGIPVAFIQLPRPPGRYNKLYFQAGNTLGGVISNTARDILQVYSTKNKEH
jgi:hypothetical protein